MSSLRRTKVTTIACATTTTTTTTEVVVTKSTSKRRIMTVTKQILSNSSSLLLLVTVVFCYFPCCYCAATSTDVTEHYNTSKTENKRYSIQKERRKIRSLTRTKLTTTATKSKTPAKTNPLISGGIAKTIPIKKKAIKPKPKPKQKPKTRSTPIIIPPSQPTATKIVPKSPVPVISPLVQPDDLPIRINCGYNSKWIDPKTKLVWKNDYGYSTSTGSLGIADKNCSKNDALSCSYQQGYIINYTIPVLQSKERYKITFVFAEPAYTSVGTRLFDIYVEGILLGSKVDTISLRNGSRNNNKLVNVSITLNDVVEDGKVNILFKSVPTLKNYTSTIQKAIVNGIIIELLPYRKLEDFPLRINSGSTFVWIDPKTKYEWLPDTDYIDTKQLTTVGTECSKQPNPFQPNDQLYCNYRLGSIINYSIRVLNFVARYNITLYFQEPSFFGKYKRPIDIFINNKIITQSFDIVNFIGSKNQPASFSTIITTNTNTTSNSNIISIKLKTASGKYYTGQKVLVSGLLIERV